MTLLQTIGAYGISVVIFFAIDMLWLGVLARDFYQRELAAFLGPVNWTAAIAFYLIFLIGILLFATLPALEKQSLAHAVLYGALFGFFTYATYDLTNLATLNNWPLTVVIVDILWGTFLSASVASLTYLAVSSRFFVSLFG